MRPASSYLLGAVGLIALAATISVLTLGPPKPDGHCNEAQIIRQAWMKALELEKLTPEDIARPTEVRITYEARQYPINDGVYRLCGRTQWYYVPAPALAGYEIRPEVNIYIAPGDCGVAYDTLVHEFLHVIHAYRNGGPPAGDEDAVNVQWPKECR